MNTNYLSVKPVAERLGLSRQTIKNLLKSGKLEGFRTRINTGKWMVESGSVERFLASMKLQELERKEQAS